MLSQDFSNFPAAIITEVAKIWSFLLLKKKLYKSCMPYHNETMFVLYKNNSFPRLELREVAGLRNNETCGRE